MPASGTPGVSSRWHWWLRHSACAKPGREWPARTSGVGGGPLTAPRMTSPLRLRLDGAALAYNGRTLAAMSGEAACGAAAKADGYGLGAIEVVKRLSAAEC